MVKLKNNLFEPLNHLEALQLLNIRLQLELDSNQACVIK